MNAHHASTIDNRQSLIDHRQSPTIELQIDELVLDTLQTDTRADLQTAIVAELERLIEEGGLPAVWLSGASIPTVKIDSNHAFEPGTAGQRIARALYRGTFS